MGLISLLLSFIIIAFIATHFFSGPSEKPESGDNGYLETRLNTEKTVNDMVNQAVPNYISEKSSEERTDDDKVLDLSNQNLKKVPEDVFSKTNLTNLDVSNNQLSGALQAEIRHLSNLRVLNLSHNNFTGVPAEVGQLSDLEVLNLSYNPLTGLPYEIGNLKKLKILNLRGTNYSKLDLEIIEKNLSKNVEIIID